MPHLKNYQSIKWLTNQLEEIVQAEKEYKNEMKLRKQRGYEVLISQGQGGAVVGRFDSLEEALACAEEGINNKEGSFAIKYPNGEMHKWSN